MLAIVAGAGALSGLLYFGMRLYAYWVVRTHTISNHAHSYTATFAYFCFTMLIPLTPLLIAECFTPSHGLLATLVPQFQKEQTSWFRTGVTEGITEGQSPSAEGSADVAAARRMTASSPVVTSVDNDQVLSEAIGLIVCGYHVVLPDGAQIELPETTGTGFAVSPQGFVLRERARIT